MEKYNPINTGENVQEPILIDKNGQTQDKNKDLNRNIILYEKTQNQLSLINSKLSKENITDIDRITLLQEREYKIKQRNYLGPHIGIPDRDSWKDKDPFVFREDNIFSLKKILEYWHEYSPDYIFLTETSAVPYGYAIKEAWKNAYPSEKIPIFYRIESWTEQDHIVEIDHENESIDGLIRYAQKDNLDLPILKQMKIGVKKYIDNRIIIQNPKIIIFDQYDKMMRPTRIRPGENTGGRTISGLSKELQKRFPGADIYSAGVNLDSEYKNRKMDFGRGGIIKKNHPRVTLKRNADQSRDPDINENLVDPLSLRSREEIVSDILEKGYRPVGRLIKDPERRKEALKYIDELKELGMIAGKEFRDGNK